MKEKQKNFEKAKMFINKVLQDESQRGKNIKALLELKRIAKASDMLNNVAIFSFSACAIAVGATFILGGITMPILASIVLGASVIGVIGSIRAKVKGNGNYAIKRVNELKKESEQIYVLNKEATVNYLGDLSLSQINKLGKFVNKEYAQGAKNAKKEIQFELENQVAKSTEVLSTEICDYVANKGKAIPNIIKNKKLREETKQQKQIELAEKQKRQKEMDKDLGIEL